MPTPPLPDSELERRKTAIEDCLREGFTPPGQYGGKGSALEEARRRIGLKSSGSLTRDLRDGRVAPDWSLYEPPVPEVRYVPQSERFGGEPPEDAVPLSEKERLGYTDEITRLKAELKAAHRTELDAEMVRKEIFGLAEQTPEPPNWLIKPRLGKSSPGVPITVWSDWHWGEVVTADEVAGKNEFNAEIAARRVRLLVERTIDICFNHMVNPDYPGIVVCLGGDMITGTIHEELAETNDRHTAPALIEVQDALAAGLTALAERFGKVFVPCVVGNHGRMTNKPRLKGRVHTSFEWLLYCQLERYFADDERVQFDIPGEADAHFRVYGHRYMLTHGDTLGVKGGDGIIGALGPILRGRIKTHTSEAQIGRDFDTLIIGHWHQHLPLPGCHVNGTLKGYDEYARLALRARYERPSQSLWFTHPKNGVTFPCRVFVDEAPRAAAGEWVSVWRAA